SQRRPSVSPRQPRYQDRLPCTTHPHSHPDESVLTPRQSGDAMIPTSLTRRTFLKTAALATAANSFASSPASRESLQQLPYNAVTLTGGPLKQHYEAIKAHYLGISNDRLLKVYRQRAGLPSPGSVMGGSSAT